MIERLGDLGLQIITAPQERLNPDGSPIGIYCKLNTRELVLPPAVSTEKYNYIFDAYFDGAFDSVALKSRKIILTYFSTGHTTENINNFTKGQTYHYLKTGLETVWQNTSSETKSKHTHSLAVALKNKYEIRRGRPLSSAHREILSSLGKARMTKEERNRIRALNKANFTPAMRERSKLAALQQWEKYKEERKTKKGEEKKLPGKSKTRLHTKTAVKAYAGKKRSQSSKKAEIRPNLKPDLKVEERLADPFSGAKRNLRFLTEELPVDLREIYIKNPNLKVEWKSVFSTISRYPYFRYERGVLFYVVPEAERDELYETTPSLLDILWNGTNSHFSQDRESIIRFGRISIEDLGSAIKYSSGA